MPSFKIPFKAKSKTKKGKTQNFDKNTSTTKKNNTPLQSTAKLTSDVPQFMITSIINNIDRVLNLYNFLLLEVPTIETNNSSSLPLIKGEIYAVLKEYSNRNLLNAIEKSRQYHYPIIITKLHKLSEIHKLGDNMLIEGRRRLKKEADAIDIGNLIDLSNNN